MTPKLASLQTAFFFEGTIGDIVKEDELSVTFRKQLSNLDLKSTILQVPKEIPDIPFLILQSKDNGHKINISNTRGDYFYNSRVFKTIEDEKELLHGYVTTMFKILQENKIKINRIGNIATFIIDNDNPIKKIEEKFIATNKQTSFDELLIRYNRKETVDHINLNVITTITSGQYKIDEKDNKAIIIQKDINSDGKYNFTEELFKQLIDTSDRLSTSATISSLFE